MDIIKRLVSVIASASLDLFSGERIKVPLPPMPKEKFVGGKNIVLAGSDWESNLSLANAQVEDPPSFKEILFPKSRGRIPPGQRSTHPFRDFM